MRKEISFFAFVGLATAVIIFRKRKVKGIQASPTAGGFPILGQVFQLGKDRLVQFLDESFNAAGRSNFEFHVCGTRHLVLSGGVAMGEVLSKRPKAFRRIASFDSWAIDARLTNGAFNVEGTEWGRIRRIVSSSFAPHHVMKMTATIADNSRQLIETLGRNADIGKDIDGLKEFMRFTINVVCSLAFGSVTKDVRYLQSSDLLDDMTDLFAWLFRRSTIPVPRQFWHFYNDRLEQRSKVVNQRVDECVEEVLRLKRVAADGDRMEEKQFFLQTLMTANSEAVGERRSLSDEEVSSQIKTFLLAGAETTSSLISSTVYLLCLPQHAALRDELVQEVDDVLQNRSLVTTIEETDRLVLLEATLRETNRLIGPAPFLMFETADKTQDEELSGGFVVGAKDVVVAYFSGAMRDASVFADPDNFLPHRWLVNPSFETNQEQQRLKRMNENFFSFGAGPRICPGQKLASVESVCALANILRNFNFSLSCSPAEAAPVILFTVHPAKLPLRLTRRNQFASCRES